MKPFLFSFALTGLLAAPAMAADMAVRMPTKASPPPVAAPINWTGFYIGVNAGYAWGRATATDLPASNGVCWADCGAQWGPDVNGFTGGLQAGWNIQLQNWVLGIEGDVGYLGLKGSAPDTNGVPALVETRGGWFATLRGRAGVLFTPTVLVYGTGGAIYAHTRTNVFRVVSNLNTNNADPWGWTAGGGIETRLGPAWSLKLEYLYYDLGNDRVGGAFGGGGTIQYFAIKQTGNIVRAGLNYRLGYDAGPITARH
jgi:outer membrane immunogenic protein